MGSPDIVALEKFYSLSPRSGVWVFEHSGEIVGVVAVDGAKAGEALGSVLGAEEGQKGDMTVIDGLMDRQDGTLRREGLRKRLASTKTDGDGDGLVQIRHLDVDHQVRRSGVGMELLATALDHAFGLESGSKRARRVILLSNPSVPRGALFAKCGFSACGEDESRKYEKPEVVGLVRAQGRWMGLDHDVWVRRRDEIFAAAGQKTLKKA